MTCVVCGGKMVKKGDTYQYDECGLRGVTLVGVTVRECEKCGEREVAIPNIEGLHRCIARSLTQRKSALLGAEVRFLRKWLGYSAQDFAGLIGVTPETVSRWENGKRDIPAVADRALRLMVLRSEPVDSYDLAFFETIAPKPPTRPRMPLTLRENHWQLAA